MITGKDGNEDDRQDDEDEIVSDKRDVSEVVAAQHKKKIQATPPMTLNAMKRL